MSIELLLCVENVVSLSQMDGSLIGEQRNRDGV